MDNVVTSMRVRPPGRSPGWFAIGMLAAIALANAPIALAQSAGPVVDVAATATETPVPAAPATPTPAATSTPVPSAVPDPAPDYPPLTAEVIAGARFPCARTSPQGGCFVDVDDRGLTFTAEFQGAEVVGSTSYAEMGHAFWDLEFPGTAIGVGPGGSVRAAISARPESIFTVVGADCRREATPFDEELEIPSTLLGNGAVIEFEVGPLDDDPMYACDFLFDPANLRHFPARAGGTAPPTDTVGAAPTGRNGMAAPALAILTGLVAGALVLAGFQHDADRGRPRTSSRIVASCTDS